MELAHRRPASLLLLLAVLYTATFLAAPAAARRQPPGRGKTGQVAVFWGRKSPDEGWLSETCDSGKYTIVIISFLDVFGQGNFPYHLDLSGHDVARVGSDIMYCQSKGILVFLSIGGFGGGQYSIPSPQAARDVADYLWNAYMGGRRRSVDRPFGNAQVDGIDFFIENGAPDNYDELARRLSNYNTGFGNRTPVQLTATPRCGSPDQQLVRQALDTALFKRIFVRFYDDASCAANWQNAWKTWTAAYPSADIYIGLPAADWKVGYVKPNDLQNVLLPQAQQAANYGGLMVWERNEDKRTGYSNNARQWA